MTTTTMAWDTIDLNMTSSAQTFIAISATALLASDGILTFSALTIGLYVLRSILGLIGNLYLDDLLEILRWTMTTTFGALCPPFLFSFFSDPYHCLKHMVFGICELKRKGSSLVIINKYIWVLAGRWCKEWGLVESLLFSSLLRKDWLEVWCG